MANTKLPKRSPLYSLESIMSGATKSSMFPAKTRESLRWFHSYCMNFKTVLTGGKILAAESNRLSKSLPGPGSVVCFFYDPKTKLKLPYFDTFPCIIVLNQYADGSFLGLNLHYLNYQARIALMGALYDNEKKNLEDIDALKVNYNMLKKASRYRWFKPAIKRYLPNHVRSKFLDVPSMYWNMVIMLPIQQFQKAGTSRVWSDSAKVYNEG